MAGNGLPPWSRCGWSSGASRWTSADAAAARAHRATLSREAFADDVAAVIRAAKAKTPVVLVGQSMGAHTAFITAARHPGVVETLVMVEGDIGGGGEPKCFSCMTRSPAGRPALTSTNR